MPATMTTVNGILKEVYEGDVNEQLNNDAVASKRIEKTSEGVFENAGGKYVVFPLHTKRNHGISYRPEGSQLAASGQQGYQQAQETLRYGYQRVRLSGQVMALAETNVQAFSSALDEEMTGAKKDVVRDQNRIVVGNVNNPTANATGIITRTNAISAGTSVTVDTTAQIEIGMVIDIVDGTGTPVAGGTAKTVTAITSSTVFVVDAAIAGVVVGNFVVRTGNWNNEPYGLNYLIGATGTVHNVNSASAGNEYWRSIVDTTATLSETAMISVCDRIDQAGGANPTAIFCSYGVRRAYFNLMLTLRRYNEPKEWPGGLIGLSFNYGKEIPLVVDKDVQAKTAFFVTENELKIYRNKQWYWDDIGGDIFKWVADFDQYQALMKCYWQLVTHQRNAHGVMNNITEA
jgi:hypothetical protein